ncbi:MAG: hypothetical protein ACRBBK_03885 [Paracoccaceae bacterium]
MKSIMPRLECAFVCGAFLRKMPLENTAAFRAKASDTGAPKNSAAAQIATRRAEIPIGQPTPFLACCIRADPKDPATNIGTLRA